MKLESLLGKLVKFRLCKYLDSHRGDVGEYCGDVGEYCGDVGEYFGEVGESISCQQNINKKKFPLTLWR